MSNYNYFGCTIPLILAKFQAGNYIPLASEFGGITSITAEMDTVESQLEGALGPEVFRSLIYPVLCQLVWRAQPGQRQFNLPACLLPIVPNSLSIWWGPPMAFQLCPRKRAEIGTTWGDNDAFQNGIAYDDSRWRTGNFRMFELQVDQFSYNPANGTGQLLAPIGPMNQDDLIYGTWQVSPTDPTFGLTGPNGARSLPSLASVMADGVASIIGPKLYSQAQAEWAYIAACTKRYDDAIAEFTSQKRIVTELRQLRWWKQVEKSNEQTMGSQQRFRA